MPHHDPYVALLEAATALRLGLADPWEVAAVLPRALARPVGAGGALAEALRQRGRLSGPAVERLAAEVGRVLAEAGGDPDLALARLGSCGSAARGLTGVPPFPRQAGHDAPSRAQLSPVAPGRYVEFRLVGEGGMGLVYWAVDTSMNRQVALKVVRPDPSDVEPGPSPDTPFAVSPPRSGTPADETFQELKRRFLQEAWVTGGLEHPGVVPVYELGQTPEGLPYYTMRFVGGRRTLREALYGVRGASLEERLSLLEPLLKVCDTLRYAHARGVVHRDLKPENVGLGEFGEVVLLDWGLAKLVGAPDAASAYWRARVEEYRESAELHTLPGALGTLGYMSPEAALGRIEDVDARSDVYGLGVILFELLTGRLPVEARTPGEYLESLLASDLPDPRTYAPDVPAALAALCQGALVRDREQRTPDVDAFARGLRGWQASRALEQEADVHLRDACASLDAAEALVGDARSALLDRAVLALGQAASKVPGRIDLEVPLRRAARVRDEVRRERERAAFRRLIRRGGWAALVLTAATAFLIAWLVGTERRVADEARARAERALVDAENLRDAALVARTRAEDLSSLRGLTVARETLFPVGESACRWAEAVIASAQAVLVRMPEHERSLAAVELRARPGSASAGARAGLEALFDDPADLAALRVLSDLVGEARRLATEPVDGPLPTLVRRFTPATHQAPDWSATVAEIADARRTPAYGGLRIVPQFGLFPLGRDPASGLHEFAHLYSGSLPVRGSDGVLQHAPDACLVFVLLPGGTFLLGSPREEFGRDREEGPEVAVSVAPFFLAKHECTTAQWSRLAGRTPPEWERSFEARRPEVRASWDDAFGPRGLARLYGLTLPTEAQWEYACRAGGRTRWSFGDDPSLLGDYTWHRGNSMGYPRPVGRLLPNAWGLHDMHGNVWERCADDYHESFEGAPSDGRAWIDAPRAPYRVLRGGGYEDVGARLRSAARARGSSMLVEHDAGLRLARALVGP